MPFEIVKQPIHFYPNPSDAPEWLREANDKIQNADGYLVISAEYNCTMPPALTNMMDHFPPWSYAYRPAAIAAYSVCEYQWVNKSAKGDVWYPPKELT